MKSIGVAYVLWFFLGVLGIHRFYLNRVGTGVLWLLTGGLLGIGWLVDLFLIPGMVRQANLEEAVMRIGTAPPPAAMPGLRVIYCTHCGAPMQVPVGGTGRQFACPSCRTVLAAPA
ncbi:MAG TPA: NINE protein [Phycisphaerae bacterium]